MFELAVAVILILLNGVLSLSELAVISARKARLKAMAEQGRSGAAAALALSEDPGRFLSTVQIGITLIAILAGAFSGAALGQRLTDVLIDRGLPTRWSEPLGYGLVISLITYLSVVVGELVPKNLALRDAEGIACLVAPLMRRVSRIAAPLVWLLDASTKLIFRMLGQSTEAEDAITAEEIRAIMAEAATAGVIETVEHKMISGVLRLGNRAVRGVMTPRTDVEWIDLNDDAFEIRERLIATTHSRLPAAEGSVENMLGVLQIRDLVPRLLKGEAFDVRPHVRQVPIIPDMVDALSALAALRKAEVPMALVHDEYGHFEGIVTPADILDAIAGAFQSDEGAAEEAVRREDGSWLIAGSMPADELADLLGITLPKRRSYETAAGLVVGELQHLPATGEAIERFGWRFEVVDLDGRRVDKILATKLGGVAAP